MNVWNDKVKRLIKSELVKRGLSSTDLVFLLKNIGIEETKSGIDSKISRGTFSASFLFQCLTVIGCSKIDVEEYKNNDLKVAQIREEYIKEKV